jgi:Cu/Ag efflux protein CusF
MLRTTLFAVTLLAVAAAAQQPQGPQQGKIKKIDADKGVIVITSGDKDLEAKVNDATRFEAAQGKPLEDKIKNKNLKEGVEVLFLARMKDGQTVLVGMRVRVPGEQAQRKIEKVDTSHLIPLTELGKDKYKDYPGGLYPDGKNERPAAHEKAGLALAKQVQPLDADGKPSADGKIVLLSVGMSNTTQEFSAFKRLANADKDKNPKLTIVDGAQGGQTAARIKDPGDNATGTKFWAVVDERLKEAGATRQQVQVAWLKEADAGPTSGFPAYAKTLQEELREIVQAMHTRFPNLKMIYLSSRIYAGYAVTPLNPEPYAYESGFSVKWLIEEQIKGDKALNFDPDKGAVKAPWLSWGPYLWANGTNKRADGLFYEESDLGNDGTHPSPAGQRKVAEQLLTFFKNDATAKRWFLAK